MDEQPQEYEPPEARDLENTEAPSSTAAGDSAAIGAN